MSMYPYKWHLKDAVFTKDKGKVFSCFACGGGSTMGYKLAGFDVIGMNEIDPRMAACYIENHKPKYAYIEPIQTFKDRDDLPAELYDLDILDGSPPCSSFSDANIRAPVHYGKKRKFREGQAEQVLDTLFFDFIELAKRLKPKVVIAENVKGILFSRSKKHVKKIYTDFEKAGYQLQHYMLDASSMGVPQKRVRVFFLAIRLDVFAHELDLNFKLPKIPFKDIQHSDEGKICTWKGSIYWDKLEHGYYDTVHPKGHYFNCVKVNPNDVCPTIVANTGSHLFDYRENKHLSCQQICQVSTFPLDYNFLDFDFKYICGMSVPPVMMANIANRVHEQIFCGIKPKTPQQQKLF